MSLSVGKKYMLGEFELDSGKYLFTHSEEQLHLPELPFQVLLYLLEHRERYVSRQELLDHFWAGSQAYEETLTKCISTIRTQLNDPPTSPHYIETRKKVGYRYIGPCEEICVPEHAIRAGELEIEKIRSVAVVVEETDEDESAPHTHGLLVPRSHHLWQRRLVLIPSAVAIVLVFLAIGLWLRPIASAPRPITTIAVLPLKNLTGDQTNDYFSDGITERLISSLSRIENLTVQSRSSVFRFKNKDIDPREVGKRLGVGAVLEGSVGNVSDSVWVTVRLVSVADGRVLWTSDEHERALGDVVKLEDEISRNVASSLRLQLSPDAQGRIARRYTADPQAFHLYLQGRFWLTNYSVPNDLKRAAKYFESATKKDPDYALAYTGLADTYLNMAIDWANPKEVMPIAQANAQKAMQLDPELGEAHYSAGAVAYFYEWNWAKARAELERALDLNAKSAETNACYLHSLEPREDPAEAINRVRRALDKNPLSVSITGELGCATYYARRYDDSINFAVKTYEMDSSFVFTHYNLARAYGQKGKYEEAIKEAKKALEILGQSSMILTELGYDYAMSGNKGEARKLLSELQTRSAHEFVDPYMLAFIYVGLAENDKALTALEQAYEARSAWMPWINVEPKFDSIHSDARFVQLLQRLKLS